MIYNMVDLYMHFAFFKVYFWNLLHVLHILKVPN